MTLASTLTNLALAAAAGLSAASALAEQKLLPAQSSVGFTAKQMGVPLQGHFKRFDARMNFDAAKPEASKVHFSVDTGSATMGAKETDAQLPKPTWFNVPQFPQATFDSTAVKALGGGKYEVAGRLSIKGQTQDLLVPVTVVQNGATTVATGSLALKRLTFKIGENEWADTSMVADEVQVNFKLALSGVGKL